LDTTQTTADVCHPTPLNINRACEMCRRATIDTKYTVL
jgi:hypothetical protein